MVVVGGTVVVVAAGTVVVVLGEVVVDVVDAVVGPGAAAAPGAEFTDVVAGATSGAGDCIVAIGTRCDVDPLFAGWLTSGEPAVPPVATCPAPALPDLASAGAAPGACDDIPGALA